MTYILALSAVASIFNGQPLFIGQYAKQKTLGDTLTIPSNKDTLILN